jgi:predicted nucleic acid-binding Zn ribbon protein
MKKKNDIVHIGSVINKVLKTHRHEFDEDLTKVWSLWNNAVGEAIAKNTRPVAFKGKLLLVHVVSSTWMHELKFLKKDIIKKINEALGKKLVEEIKFKIGPV